MYAYCMVCILTSYGRCSTCTTEDSIHQTYIIVLAQQSDSISTWNLKYSRLVKLRTVDGGAVEAGVWTGYHHHLYLICVWYISTAWIPSGLVKCSQKTPPTSHTKIRGMRRKGGDLDLLYWILSRAANSTYKLELVPHDKSNYIARAISIKTIDISSTLE